jgi:ribosome maturation factor RimP
MSRRGPQRTGTIGYLIPVRLGDRTTAQVADEEVVMHGSSRHTSPRPAAKGGQPSAAGPADAQELTRLLQPVVSATGMDLENVRITATGRRRLLRVIVDADGGVSLDDITLISRALSAELDANRAMGETPYTLEVSSPGVDRPLTEPRHWRRAAGRLVRVPLAARSQFVTDGSGRPGAIEARVLAASDHAVVLEVAGEQREFGYAELGQGKIVLEFGHAAAGADGGKADGH